MEKSEITATLVRRLVAAQFPHWADLVVTPVEHDGWDNSTFRLGAEMSVRLPSGDIYTLQVEKEHRWLPVLAPGLPLPIPRPRGKGRPTNTFPRPWSVYGWLAGEPATGDRVVDRERFAVDLAAFLGALYRIDAADGPAAGPHSHFRGSPPSTWDAQVRAAAAALDGRIDTEAVVATWERALRSTFEDVPVWVHGDVVASNLLVTDGALSAVIDFGCSAVGDPACDVAAAWTIFSGSSRRAFRDALAVDDGTWERGRGWALWKALIEIQHGDIHDAGAAQPGWVRMGWRTNAEALIQDLVSER